MKNTFLKYLEKEIKSGMHVAEIYHGEKNDILRKLSQCVGREGHVYGIDRLNPFNDYKKMRALERNPNITLHRIDFPNVKEIDAIPSLDAIIIREFIWTYNIPYDGTRDLRIYETIDRILKPKGSLIINLNRTEQINEKNHSIYQRTISEVLPNFKITIFDGDCLGYKKS